MSGISNNIIFSAMAHSILLATALLIGGSREFRMASLLTVSLFDEKENTVSTHSASGGVTQSVPAPRSALKAVAKLSAAQPIIAKQDLAPLAPVKPQSDNDRNTGTEVAGSGAQSNSTDIGGNNPSSVNTQNSRGGSGEAGAAFTSRGQTAQTGTDASLKQRIRDALQANLVYPYIARKRRLEGTVLMEFRINGRGLPEAVRIVKGSSYSILDEAARETVLKSSPFPAKDNIIEVPIRFSLKGD